MLTTTSVEYCSWRGQVPCGEPEWNSLMLGKMALARTDFTYRAGRLGEAGDSSGFVQDPKGGRGSTNCHTRVRELAARGGKLGTRCGDLEGMPSSLRSPAGRAGPVSLLSSIFSVFSCVLRPRAAFSFSEGETLISRPSYHVALRRLRVTGLWPAAQPSLPRPPVRKGPASCFPPSFDLTPSNCLTFR